MKSQLMTALSIVGVLGTATTAMAVNTDVLANVDQITTGTATDTLLPDPAGSNAPASLDAPTATPAPSASTDPSVTPATPGTTAPGGTSTTTVNEGGQAPAVQTPASPVVNGTTGGSGSRVSPAANTSSYVEDEDHDEDHEDEDEHEEEDDD